MMRKWMVFMVMALALAAFSGCGDQAGQSDEGDSVEIVQEKTAPAAEEAATPAPTPTPAPEPIKIGAVFAITGPASFLGEPEAQTARMLAEKINAQGGVNGRPIELLVKDSQGDETRGRNAVTDLIREDVVAIIGPSRSGTTLAVSNLCNQQQVPLISCAASQKITNPVLPYVFKTAQRDDHAVQRIYDYMTSQGWTSVAFMTGTTGFGAAGRQELLDIAKTYNMEVVADETYGPKDMDMTVQLKKIQEKNPGAIVNWSIVPAQSVVLKNRKTLGMETPIFQSHGFGNIKYVQAAGPAADGVLFPASAILIAEALPVGHPGRDTLIQYKTEYEKRFQQDVSAFGGYAHDAMMLVVDACKNTDASRPAIRDYIENLQGFAGVTGVFNFSAQDHTGLDKETSFMMLTVENGGFALAK